jgi:hypothetical protein
MSRRRWAATCAAVAFSLMAGHFLMMTLKMVAWPTIVTLAAHYGFIR